jgi:hypothetical protein
LAVTAKFQADFSSFLAAVQKADVSLKTFESGAGQVEKALTRMANSFSGQQVIRDATLAAEAVERIGGAAMLTEREQARVNAQVTEALAKFKALGQSAPQSMVDLANATAKIPEKLSLVDRAAGALKSTFGQMFGAFTAANLADRAISSLVSLGREAVKAAGDTLDLASKTGLTTDTIQRMGFVAKQTGANVEDFTRAAFMLGVNLEKGKGQIEGLTASYEELKALNPDDQFEAVVKQLEAMEDPQKRNEIAVRLFGRAAQDVLPAIAQGYTDIAKQAVVAKQEQLKAVDEMSDKWDGFVHNTKTRITSFLGSWVDAQEKLRKLTPEQFVRLEELKRQGLSTAEALAKIFPPDVNLKFEGTVKKTTAATEELGKVAKVTAVSVKDLTKEMDDFAAKVTKANQVTKRDGAMADSLQGLNDLIKANRRELMLLQPVMTDWAAKNAETTKTLLDMVAAGMHLPAVTEAQRKKFLETKDATATWKTELDALARSMTDLAQVAGSSLVSALASLTNGINVGIKAWDSLKKGMDALTSGGGLKSILGGLTGIVSGIGGIVSAAQAAIGIGKALFNIFDRDKGRDLVEDFVKQFGGFDGIQKIFAEMGDEGHRLWVMLTQGVGRNNPDQARAAIEEVTRAIEAFRNAANSIPRDISVNIRTIDSTDLEHRGGEIEGFAGGSKGFRNFGRGTLAMLHGVEAVIRPGDAVPGGGEHVTNVYLDGDVLVRHVERGLDRKYRSRQPVGAAA